MKTIILSLILILFISCEKEFFASDKDEKQLYVLNPYTISNVASFYDLKGNHILTRELKRFDTLTFKAESLPVTIKLNIKFLENTGNVRYIKFYDKNTDIKVYKDGFYDIVLD